MVVHLADAEQFPHRLAEEIEEERRLFHVAVTRARRAVTIVTGPRPSPFVAELTTEPPDLVTSRPGLTGRAAASTGAGVVGSARAAGRGGRGGAPRPTGGAEGELFERLRAWRKEASDGKPAYTVFSDATLAELVERRPGSLAELARVRGVGPAKLDKYGADVLRVLGVDGASAAPGD